MAVAMTTAAVLPGGGVRCAARGPAAGRQSAAAPKVPVARRGAPISISRARDVRAFAKTRRPRKDKKNRDAAAPCPPENLTVGYKQEADAAPTPTAADLEEEEQEEPDFWEGEQWELLGKVAGAGLFIIAGLTALVGAYASSTYNEGSMGVKFPDVTGNAEQSVDYFAD